MTGNYPLITEQSHNSHLRIFNSIVLYSKFKKLQREVLSSRLEYITPFSRMQNDPEIHVILLGESATRRHHGCYGYFQNTTPMIIALGDIVCFGNCISRYAHTAEAVPSIFTLLRTSGNRSEPTSLISILRQCGAKVHWISNQDPIGIYDNAVTAIAATCNSTYFIQSAPRLDEQLLPRIAEAINVGMNAHCASVIIVHLMGSHIIYKDRFPALRNSFSISEYNRREPYAREIICDYDNSIAYTDLIISKIIDLIKKSKRPGSMIYLSDHGDDVFDCWPSYGHDAAVGTPPMYEIPLLVWASKNSRQREKISLAMTNCNKLWSSDNFSASYLDFLGIYDPSIPTCHSIFNPFMSPCAPNGKHNVSNLCANYSDRALALMRLLSLDSQCNKIWLHKVNTKSDAEEYARIFGGYEFDIEFDGSRPYVFHRPDPNTGNQLFDHLQNFTDDKSILWFDIKQTNLSVGTAINAIDDAVRRSNISSNRIIHECSNLELAAALKSRNKIIAVNASVLLVPSVNMSATLRAIIGIHPDYISCARQHFAFLVDQFPPETKYLCWDTSLSVWSSRDVAFTASFLRDNPNVRAFILRFGN